MSQENVEIARAAFDAWNRGDLEGWLAAAAPDVEFHPAGVFPDFDAVFRGREGLTRFWEAIHEPWDELRADIEDIEEKDEALVLDIKFRGRGHSGAEVELSLATALRTRNGLAVTMISAATAAQAWEALVDLERRQSKVSE